ncbi:cathepsin F [Clonorchis sinensis]|uniref:Cathepsin F n=1 Tax=Clonorchis sinensis TaxID=79923 RepID=G7Y398_CLOSI|nr:cathepsin F [Clonorchis sinensis]
MSPIMYLLMSLALMQLNVESNVQQLVDCDHVDRGCEGGFPLDAFMAVQRLGGLQLSIDYPYIASRQACQFNPKQAVAFVTGFAALPRNELLIAEYLHRNGPLSVGLNSRTLKFYNSGILNLAAEQCDPEALNHAALAVGFGTDESTPFWIIKNTFGKDWGEQLDEFEDERELYENFKAEYDKTYEGRDEEFRRLYLTYKSPDEHEPIDRIHVQEVGQLPSYFDWREYGAVGPVRNQGQCGSCWAISAEVVDCDHADHGCSGGFPIHAYECVQRLGGLELAVRYPYVGYQQYCQADPRYFVAYINGSVALPKDSEQIAKFLATFGPLSVVLDARLLQYYRSGILNPSVAYCNPEELNHAVLSVGFGTEQGIPYWIIKNSWGEQWGEQHLTKLKEWLNTQPFGHKRLIGTKSGYIRQSYEDFKRKYGKQFIGDAEEFKALYLTAMYDHRKLNQSKTTEPETVGEPQDSFDWRDYGAVGPVLDQDRCGASWAFSAIGNIEGQYFMRVHRLLSLSEQQLVDCDRIDQGCAGGTPYGAFEGIQQLGGLELEADYPYLGHQDNCQSNPLRFVVSINGSVQLPKDEDQIAQYLFDHGPLSVGINGALLQYYSSGIMQPLWDNCNPAEMNHAGLAVGFGFEQDVPYWTIKNSWGMLWGEEDNIKQAEFYQTLERGTALYGVTQFSDLTGEEFQETFLGLRLDEQYSKSQSYVKKKHSVSIPENYDWRPYGAVGPVLDQGHCGSCWAFSVIGNIEGQWFRKTGQLVSLSKQQLVDCDRSSRGCGGGYPPATYDSIRRIGGLEIELDYRYTGRDGVCHQNPRKFVAYVNSSVALTKDENTIAEWLSYHGPISMALNARLLQFYVSGIMHPPAAYCPVKDISHAVLSVGFGTKGNVPFWIVKNSWGTLWGEEGYFRIYRGDDMGALPISQPTNNSRLMPYHPLRDATSRVTSLAEYSRELRERQLYEEFKLNYGKVYENEGMFYFLYLGARFDREPSRAGSMVVDDLGEIPERFDWRELGAVGPIQDQGDCGSCWAFSTIGNIEGQWFKKTGQLLTLSEQQLIDCDSVDDGCGGGYPPDTYGDIVKMGGLELNADYPYIAADGVCKMERSKFRAYVNKSLVLPTKEDQQAVWLSKNGPLSAGINADYLQVVILFYERSVNGPITISEF